MSLLQQAFLFFLFSCASFFQASKESAEACGGDYLGVIWLDDEDQNIWRSTVMVFFEVHQVSVKKGKSRID